MRDLSISFLVLLSLVALASIAATQRDINTPIELQGRCHGRSRVNTHNLNPTHADLDLIQEAE